VGRGFSGDASEPERVGAKEAAEKCGLNLIGYLATINSSLDEWCIGLVKKLEPVSTVLGSEFKISNPEPETRNLKPYS